MDVDDSASADDASDVERELWNEKIFDLDQSEEEWVANNYPSSIRYEPQRNYSFDDFTTLTKHPAAPSLVPSLAPSLAMSLPPSPMPSRAPSPNLRSSTSRPNLRSRSATSSRSALKSLTPSPRASPYPLPSPSKNPTKGWSRSADAGFLISPEESLQRPKRDSKHTPIVEERKLTGGEGKMLSVVFHRILTRWPNEDEKTKHRQSIYNLTNHMLFWDNMVQPCLKELYQESKTKQDRDKILEEFYEEIVRSYKDQTAFQLITF
jgi:hypothetical protein